jgi:DNA-binding XRE family transcriptional regulator
MSLPHQATPNNSIKKERLEAASPSSGQSKVGRQQPRTVRLTVSLPGDLVDRLRDAVYWSPDLKLAWLIAQSLRASLSDLEASRQGPFPKRTMALRAGRPRLVGQSMKVHPRIKLNANGTARSTEGITQATLASQPSIE